MIENKNIHQVVMAREMYDQLIRLAEMGVHAGVSSDDQQLRKIKRHVRKFNTDLHNERVNEVEQVMYHWDRSRRELKDFIALHQNKALFGEDDGGVFEARVLGPSPTNKLYVMLRDIHRDRVIHCDPRLLIAVLPDNMAFNPFNQRYYAFCHAEVPKIVKSLEGLGDKMKAIGLETVMRSNEKHIVLDSPTATMNAYIEYVKEPTDACQFRLHIASKSRYVQLATISINISVAQRLVLEDLIFTILSKAGSNFAEVMRAINTFKDINKEAS